MKSVLQTDKKCYICGSTVGRHDHHIFPGNRRKWSEKYGLKCYLCYEHHEGNSGVHMNPNKGIDLELKQAAQVFYEVNIGTREDFIGEFGKSYL